jgi:hypothetical protein
VVALDQNVVTVLWVKHASPKNSSFAFSRHSIEHLECNPRGEYRNAIQKWPMSLFIS